MSTKTDKTNQMPRARSKTKEILKQPPTYTHIHPQTCTRFTRFTLFLNSLLLLNSLPQSPTPPPWKQTEQKHPWRQCWWMIDITVLVFHYQSLKTQETKIAQENCKISWPESQHGLCTHDWNVTGCTILGAWTSEVHVKESQDGS